MLTSDSYRVPIKLTLLNLIKSILWKIWPVIVDTTELLHKSHNVPVSYPTMYHFVTEMCTCVHIYVKKRFIMGYPNVQCIVEFICRYWLRHRTLWRHTLPHPYRGAMGFLLGVLSHSLPGRMSYGVSAISFFEKIDCLKLFCVRWYWP